MKFLLMTGILFSLNTMAAEYDCRSIKKDQATLSIQQNRVEWYDRSHSASSLAKYTGIDTAPYSPQKGYYVFDLVNFYRTEDSNFWLKLPPNYQTQKTIKVYEGFNNDGHDESMELYVCNRVK